MTRIAVIGIGSTRFGDHADRTTRQLAAGAVAEALADCEQDGRGLDAAYFGCGITGLLDGQEGMVGQLALRELGIVGLPVMRIENACASSACAVREAALSIRAGAAEIALACGVEKMRGVPTPVVTRALAGDGDVPLEADAGLVFPAVFAMMAREHMRRFGTPREALAAVAEKAHRNGARNPKAHMREPVTREQAMQGRPVASPLTVYDCCPVSDGATAVVLASEAAARRFPGPKVWLESCALVSGTYDDDADLVSFQATRRAAAKAYQEAGIGPRDVDFAEVHDCFTIAEIMHSEDLGFFDKGDGGFAVLRGDTAIEGRLPINASGGLKAKGHPVGATGAGQIVEATLQLRGRAGDRQVADAQVGLTHCMGGFFGTDCGSLVVSVLVR
ncbi:MAG: beta-ketoacyl synthase N-terminal-like domain-containing protein [Dongiaceae bacterium]